MIPNVFYIVDSHGGKNLLSKKKVVHLILNKKMKSIHVVKMYLIFNN